MHLRVGFTVLMHIFSNKCPDAVMGSARQIKYYICIGSPAILLSIGCHFALFDESFGEVGKMLITDTAQNFN